MDDIRTRVHARSDLDQLRAERDIDRLAAELNAERVMDHAQRFITARAVMAECANGTDILDALEQASANKAVAWALKFLGQEAGLDIGDPFTLGMVDQLVAASVLTAQHGVQLKAMSLQPVVVTRDQVNAALFNPDGTEK